MIQLNSGTALVNGVTFFSTKLPNPVRRFSVYFLMPEMISPPSLARVTCEFLIDHERTIRK